MVTGFRVLWRALIHFWDESMLMIRTNLIWFFGSLPLYLLTVLACAVFIPPLEAETGPSIWAWLLAAFLILVIPSPFAVGAYAIANFVANEETPEFGLFWRAVRLLWKKALMLYVIGTLIFGALVFNLSFYMSMTEGVLQSISILWFYVILYWLTLQAYLLPLLVNAALPPPPPTAADDGWPVDDPQRRAARPTPPPAPEPEILGIGTLYKRAAILALANPVFSLILLIAAFLIMVISSFALPILPLLAMSYVALAHCRALRALREKYFPSEARGATG